MKMFWKLMMIVTLGASLLAQAPAKNTADQPAKKEAAEVQEPKPAPPDNFYKLNFAIYELEDGKRTNQRDYSMIGRTNERTFSVRSSTRVPIYSEEKKVTYVDAGLDIRCSLKEMVLGKLQAQCDVNISNFVMPDQIADGGRSAVGAPVMRTTNASTWAVLTPGKPTIVSTIDDVNSKKRTQIEVIATRME
jgi:hypothetical protein